MKPDDAVSNPPPSLESLFDQAVQIPAERRQAWLDGACADQPALREKLERLLRFDAAELGIPVGDLLASSRSALNGGGEESEPAGRFGAYEIIGRLGVGGMGVVLEARQDRPRRQVALKLIRPELATRETRRRFEREAQILGRLQHPGIAQVYEVGEAEVASPTGGRSKQTYLAMELVRGAAIDQHARSGRCSVEDRVRLFIQVCDAVHYAHLNGVIHRDLKPGNILVNDAGYVKILDFGVARLVSRDTDATLYTHAGQLVGTPAYMSPEQVGGNHELNARSDVYALGVVLYELLTGRLPYDVRDVPLAEAARRIREEEPTRLSGSDARLRGDLDTIVGKALEKEPARRYASAQELAEDLRRFLDSEPISARPVSTWYQIVKFSKRNRRFVAALGVAFLVLAAGVVVSSALAVHAQRVAREAKQARDKEAAQRRNAEINLARADAMQQFILWGLGFVGQDSANADMTVMETLEYAEQRIDLRFKDRPLDEAMARFSLGKLYAHHLGQAPRALPQFQRALELWKTHGLPDDATLVWTYYGLSQGERDAGLDVIEVQSWTLDLLAVLQRQVREESPELADVVDEMLAVMLQEPTPSDAEVRRVTQRLVRRIEEMNVPCESVAMYAAYQTLLNASVWLGNRGIHRPSSFDAHARGLDYVESRCAQNDELMNLWRWLVARNLAIRGDDPRKVVAICDRLIAGIQRHGRAEDYFFCDAVGIKGEAFAQLGDLDEAERLLRDSQDRVSRAAPLYVGHSITRLLRFAERSGRWEPLMAALPTYTPMVPQPLVLEAESRIREWVKQRNDVAWRIVRRAELAPALYADALTLAERVVALLPDEADYVNTLGVAQFRAGDFAGAVATLSHSSELAAAHGRSEIADWAFLALAHAELGRVSEATAAMRRCEEIARSHSQLSAENAGFLAEARAVLQVEQGERMPKPGNRAKTTGDASNSAAPGLGPP